MKYIDLKAEYDLMRDEINEAIERVIENSSFIMGPEVASLEQELAHYFQVDPQQVVTVSSGTDALWLALVAANVQPGDEIITTPFTFAATAEAISQVGAKPVFVDIDPFTYNINTDLIEAAITSRTKGILPVHLYGLSADMDQIQAIAQKHKLWVIEDVAQAMGSEYKGKKAGLFGEMSCFSFFPSKNLGCYGDGGMILVQDQEKAQQLRALRAHGSHKKYEHEILGFNARLDALQAAILRVKLKHFPKALEDRLQVAKFYMARLRNESGLRLPVIPPQYKHTFNQFTIRVLEREKVAEALKSKDIPTAVHYPKPLHLQKAWAFLGHKQGDFPESELAAKQVLSLPMHPYMSEEEINQVCKAIIECKLCLPGQSS